MKFVISIQLALTSLCLMLCSNALAYTIDGGATDVGTADSVLASTSLASSGEAVETAWVESVLGISVSLSGKTDFVDLSGWVQATESDSVFVHALSSDPGYFLLKIGTGSSGADSHYLFSNADSMSYAVLDLAGLGIDPATATFSFSRISHLTEFSVPESTSLILLSMVLLGLGFARRRA